jgi:geranylgeranyl transferase type-2 subunit beta
MEPSREFLGDKHVKYVKDVSCDTSSFEFCVTEHLRMSGVYWGLATLATMGTTPQV